MIIYLSGISDWTPVIGIIVGAILIVALIVRIICLKRRMSCQVTGQTIKKTGKLGKKDDFMLERVTQPKYSIQISSILTNEWYEFPLPQIEEYEELESEILKENHDGIDNAETIVPYDSNRVILKNKVNGNDYYNASWITQQEDKGHYDTLRPFSYQPYEETSFIVARAPLSYSCSLFHEMIIQEKVGIVLYLNDKIHTVKEATGKVYQIDHIKRQIDSEMWIQEYLHRREVTISSESKGNIFSHSFLEYRYNVMEDIQSEGTVHNFMQMFCQIRNTTNKSSKILPFILVDQVSGCGFSGVFIILYKALERIDNFDLEQENKNSSSLQSQSFISVFSMVSKLRLKRAKMVGTFDYYKFIYRCIQYYVSNKKELSSVSALKNVESAYVQDLNINKIEMIHSNSCFSEDSTASPISTDSSLKDESSLNVFDNTMNAINCEVNGNEDDIIYVNYNL